MPWFSCYLAVLIFCLNRLLQAMHEEELVEVHKNIKNLQEDNQTLKDKREALERDMSIAEDEMINLKKDLDEITKEKKDLERNHEQLKKELEEQGLLSINY